MPLLFPLSGARPLFHSWLERGLITIGDGFIKFIFDSIVTSYRHPSKVVAKLCLQRKVILASVL